MKIVKRTIESTYIKENIMLLSLGCVIMSKRLIEQYITKGCQGFTMYICILWEFANMKKLAV
jgi:hypothetical protein